MPTNADLLAAHWDGVSEVVLGEITTGLLMSADPLTSASARHLMASLVNGSRPLRAGQPIERVTSTDIPISVDTNIETAKGALIPAVGIVTARAVLTGGHVIQGSAHVRAVPGEGSVRRRWFHYNARPGYVELHRPADPAGLVAGFLGSRGGPAVLDLAGAGGQLVDRVHDSPELKDKEVRLRSEPLGLRWAALVHSDAGGPTAEVDRYEDGRFHIRAVTGPEHVSGLVRFCEDVALHRWLLSTISDLLDVVAYDDDLEELGPALEYLGHLWSPGEGGTGDDVAVLWQSIEDRLHLTRGWQNQVTRIRDQVLLRTHRRLVRHSEREQSSS